MSKTQEFIDRWRQTQVGRNVQTGFLLEALEALEAIQADMEELRKSQERTDENLSKVHSIARGFDPR